MDFQAKIQEKGKVLMPDTKTRDALGEAMNLYREVSKHKTFENGSKCSE
jgi:hypothetical protein